MSSTSSAAMGSFYRPKRLVRPIRRQMPVFWLVGGVLLVGVLGVSIAWRNLAHERMETEVALQWSQIERLEKEIKHLNGKIESETALNRIQPWARNNRGWRKNDAAVHDLEIRVGDLTPGALTEVQMLRGHDD